MRASLFILPPFGKIVNKFKKDGFLVTQFLSNDTIPILREEIDLSYKIDYSDNHQGNFVNGTIVDYGGAVVYK